MVGEVFRLPRDATPGQIGRRADDHVAVGAEDAHLEVAVDDLAGAHHDIEAFFDYVDQPVGEVEFQVDVGVGAKLAADAGNVMGVRLADDLLDGRKVVAAGGAKASSHDPILPWPSLRRNDGDASRLTSSEVEPP